MGGKKILTQADLDAMTPEQVLNISVDQIPEGYDIDSSLDGKNPKLIPLPVDDCDCAKCSEEPPFTTLGIVDADGKVEEEFVEGCIKRPTPTPVDTPIPITPFTESEEEAYNRALDDDQYRKLSPEGRYEKTRGILFLRFFSEDPSNGKVLSRLRKVVYFPQEPIKEGWYVACVVKEFNNHGIMDTMTLDSVPLELWQAKSIKGVHTEYDYPKRQLKIYPAVPKHKLKTERPPCIHTINLPIEKGSNTISIKEVLEEKRSEALQKLNR